MKIMIIMMISHEWGSLGEDLWNIRPPNLSSIVIEDRLTLRDLHQLIFALKSGTESAQSEERDSKYQPLGRFLL
jgi:hypothetical protein